MSRNLYEMSSHKKKRMKESCEKDMMKNITKCFYHKPLEKNKLDEVDLNIIFLLHDEGPSEAKSQGHKLTKKKR